MGSSKTTFINLDGIAPAAKISFFDIGLRGSLYLQIPSLKTILESAENSGSRVHSNSWGSSFGIYGQQCYDLDDFTFHRKENLVIFAAGNFGSFGRYSIVAPANAKNVLTVGGEQVTKAALNFNTMVTIKLCFHSVQGDL